MFGFKKKTGETPDPAPGDSGGAKKKRKRFWLVGGAGLLLVAIGTGIAFFLWYPDSSPDPTPEEEAGMEAVAEMPPAALPGHVAFGTVTLPIAGIDEERWQLRARVDFMVDRPEAEARIRRRHDEILAILQSIGAGHSPEDLMTTAGKLRLKYAWFAAVNRALAPLELRALYITDLLLLPLDEAPEAAGNAPA